MQESYRQAHPLTGRTVWNTSSSAIISEIPNYGAEILSGAEDRDREACICVSDSVNEAMCLHQLSYLCFANEHIPSSWKSVKQLWVDKDVANGTHSDIGRGNDRHLA
jgi:hypothetical protein